MFDQLEILRMAGGLAGTAAARQGAIARNVANANTPGYKAVDVPDFAATYSAGDGLRLRATRPGHALTNPDTTGVTAVARRHPGTESPDGNSVSLEGEMVAAAGARHQHDMALAIYRSSTGLLRSALGSGR
jgi:flagellar basal-body rod protein FlgB